MHECLCILPLYTCLSAMWCACRPAEGLALYSASLFIPGCDNEYVGACGRFACAAAGVSVVVSCRVT